MRLIRITALFAGLSLLGAAGTSTAAASVRPSADAGYVINGKHLDYLQIWLRLPRPWLFARETGSVGVSVQLWTAREVLDLRVSACTDATCKAGGRPAHRSYHKVFDVYSRRTHALICATNATGRRRCPASGGNLSRAPIAPDHLIAVWMSDDLPPYQDVDAGAGPNGFNYAVQSRPSKKPVLDFIQGRIVTEFGTSPWASPRLRAPARRLTLLSFRRLSYIDEVTNVAEDFGCIGAPWWHNHRITTSPGRAHAVAGPLQGHGCNFTVYLIR